MKKTIYGLITILYFICLNSYSQTVHPVGGNANDLKQIMKNFTYVIIDNDFTIDSALTVPKNVTIDFRSGKFNILSGVTLLFNGTLKADSYQIFKGDGKVLGNPKVDKIYPQWWGADPTENIDNTTAIQAAINLGDLIYFPYLGKEAPYRVHNTLTLHDNTTLLGESGVIIRSKFNIEGEEEIEGEKYHGGYSNTIVSAVDKNNIRIENIIFNFDKSNIKKRKILPGTVKPGIYFKDSKNISFENVFLTQFLTNKDSKKSHLYGVAIFENCENITINKLKQSSITEEGIQFYDCKNVNLTNSWGSSGNVTFSTFFGFWRCDGVILKNTTIRASSNGGSVVNCYSRNVLIENLRLNEDELSHRARGIDLANEGQDIEYDCYNITIKNCYLKCKSYGIQGGAYSQSYGADILTIENNYIDVVEDTGSKIYNGKLMGIRIDSPQIVNISNNKILLGNASGSAIGRCILISNHDLAGKILKGIKIDNNEMKGQCGIAYNSSSSIDLNSLTIKNNLFTAQGLSTLDGAAYKGASTFMFIRQLDESKSLFFDNILLENNVVDNIGGGLFVVNGGNISFGNVSIVRNTFKGRTNGTNCELFIRMLNKATSNKKSVLRIQDNNFYDPHSLKIYNFDNVFISKNILEWTNKPAPVTSFRIRNCSKTLTITDNRLINAENNAARYDVENINNFVRPIYTDISRNVKIKKTDTPVASKFRINGFNNTF